MKITLTALLTLASVLNAQNVPLTKPQIILAPVLNEYTEQFATTAMNPTAPTLINTAKPIKTGTVVWVYLRGLVQTPIEAVKKTAEPLTVQIDASQISDNTVLVVVYKSEQ